MKEAGALFALVFVQILLLLRLNQNMLIFALIRTTLPSIIYLSVLLCASTYKINADSG